MALCDDELEKVLSSIDDATARDTLRETVQEFRSLADEKTMSADQARNIIRGAITKAQERWVAKQVTDRKVAKIIEEVIPNVPREDLGHILMNTLYATPANAKRGSLGAQVAPRVAQADTMAYSDLSAALEGVDIRVNGRDTPAFDIFLHSDKKEYQEIGWALANVLAEDQGARAAIDKYGEGIKHMADAIRRTMDESHDRLLEIGLLSSDIKGYFPQSHSAAAISTQYDEWSEYVAKYADRDYHGQLDERRVRSIAESILTRRQDTLDFGGPTETRVLHIQKDAQIDYVRRFSGKNAQQLIIDKLARNERRLIVADAFGPDYRSGYTQIRQAIEARLSTDVSGGRIGAKAADEAREALRKADDMWSALKGDYMGEINVWRFRTSVMTSMVSMSKLGKVALYGLHDATFGAVRHVQTTGEGVGSGVNYIASAAKAIVTGDAKIDNVRFLAVQRATELANATQLERMSGDSIAQFDIGPAVLTQYTPKEVEKFNRNYKRMLRWRERQHTFFRAVLATRVTQATHLTGQRYMLETLGNVSDMTMDQLRSDVPHLADIMDANGVSRYWDEVRAALAEDPERGWDNLSRRPKSMVMSMLRNEADKLIGRPNAYLRSQIQKYGQPGTVAGNAFIAGTQFLAARYTIWRDVYGEALERSGSQWVAMVAAGISVTAIGIYLGDITSSKPVYDFRDRRGNWNVELITRAVAESGVIHPLVAGLVEEAGRGIQRDELLNVDRLVGSAPGPAAGTAAEMLEIGFNLAADSIEKGRVSDKYVARGADAVIRAMPYNNAMPAAFVLNQGIQEFLDSVDRSRPARRIRSARKSGKDVTSDYGRSVVRGVFD